MSDTLPCYANRIHTKSAYKSSLHIKQYIDREIERWKNETGRKTGIIVISITEKDDNWKKWIEVLQKYPQVTFTRTRTKYHAGNYWCFLACIPCVVEW